MCDLNGDAWPDLVVTRNSERPVVFMNRGAAPHRPLAVRLAGKPPNPTAVGARVTVVHEDGSLQTADVHAGSGYLSQSSTTLFFGLGRRFTIKKLTVRWPGGHETTHEVDMTESTVTIQQPE